MKLNLPMDKDCDQDPCLKFPQLDQDLNIQKLIARAQNRLNQAVHQLDLLLDSHPQHLDHKNQAQVLRNQSPDPSSLLQDRTDQIMSTYHLEEMKLVLLLVMDNVHNNRLIPAQVIKVLVAMEWVLPVVLRDVLILNLNPNHNNLHILDLKDHQHNHHIQQISHNNFNLHTPAQVKVL